MPVPHFRGRGMVTSFEDNASRLGVRQREGLCSPPLHKNGHGQPKGGKWLSRGGLCSPPLHENCHGQPQGGKWLSTFRLESYYHAKRDSQEEGGSPYSLRC